MQNTSASFNHASNLYATDVQHVDRFESIGSALRDRAVAHYALTLPIDLFDQNASRFSDLSGEKGRHMKNLMTLFLYLIETANLMKDIKDAFHPSRINSMLRERNAGNVRAYRNELARRLNGVNGNDDFMRPDEFFAVWNPEEDVDVHLPPPTNTEEEMHVDAPLALNERARETAFKVPLAVFVEEVQDGAYLNAASAAHWRKLSIRFDRYARAMKARRPPLAYTFHLVIFDPTCNFDLEHFVTFLERNNMSMSLSNPLRTVRLPQRFFEERCMSVQIENIPGRQGALIGDGEDADENAERRHDGGPWRRRQRQQRGNDQNQNRNNRARQRATHADVQSRAAKYPWEAAQLTITPTYRTELYRIYTNDRTYLPPVAIMNEDAFIPGMPEDHPVNANNLFSLTNAIAARPHGALAVQTQLPNTIYTDYTRRDPDGMHPFEIPPEICASFYPVHESQTATGIFFNRTLPHVQTLHQSILGSMYEWLFSCNDDVFATLIAPADASENHQMRSLHPVDDDGAFDALPSVHSHARSKKDLRTAFDAVYRHVAPPMINGRVIHYDELVSLVESSQLHYAMGNGAGDPLDIDHDDATAAGGGCVLPEWASESNNDSLLSRSDLEIAQAELQRYEREIQERRSAQERYNFMMNAASRTSTRETSTEDDGGASNASGVRHKTVSEMLASMNVGHETPFDRAVFLEQCFKDCDDCLDMRRIAQINLSEKERVLRIIDSRPDVPERYKRALLYAYRISAINRYRTLCSTKANTPDAMKGVFEYAQRTNLVHGARPLMRRYAENLGRSCSMLAFFNASYVEAFGAVMPQLVMKFNLGGYTCSIYEYRGRPHLLVKGGTSVGKTWSADFVQYVLRIFLEDPPEWSTTHTVSRSTEHANSTNDGGRYNFAVIIDHELAATALTGDPKKQEVSGNREEKQILDQARFRVYSCYVDDDGCARRKTRYVEAVQHRICLTNDLRIFNMLNGAAVQRYLVLEVSAPKNHHELMLQEKNNEIMLDQTLAPVRARISRFHHIIQYVVANIDWLIATHVNTNVNEWLVKFLMLHVCEDIRKQNCVAIPIRTLQHITDYAAVICKVEAAGEFIEMGGRFAGDPEKGIPPSPITIDNIAALEPQLCIKTRHAVAALGLIVDDIFPKVNEAVRKGLLSYFTNNARKGAAVLKSYFLPITREHHDRSFDRTSGRRDDAQPPVESAAIGGSYRGYGISPGDGEMVDYNWVVFNETNITSIARAIKPLIDADPSIGEIYHQDSIRDALTSMMDLTVVACEYTINAAYRHETTNPNYDVTAYLIKTNTTQRTTTVKFRAGRFAVNTDFLFTAKAKSPIKLVKKSLERLFRHRHQPRMDILWRHSSTYNKTHDVIKLGLDDCDNERHKQLVIPNLAQKSDWELRWLFPNHVAGHDSLLEVDSLIIDRSLDEVAAATHLKNIHYGTTVTERTLLETIYELPRVFNVELPSWADPTKHAPLPIDPDGTVVADPYDFLNDTDDIEIRKREYMIPDPLDPRKRVSQVDVVLQELERSGYTTEQALGEFKIAFAGDDLSNARVARFRERGIYPDQQRSAEDQRAGRARSVGVEANAGLKQCISKTLGSSMFTSAAAANLFKKLGASQRGVTATQRRRTVAREQEEEEDDDDAEEPDGIRVNTAAFTHSPARSSVRSAVSARMNRL